MPSPWVRRMQEDAERNYCEYGHYEEFDKDDATYPWCKNERFHAEEVQQELYEVGAEYNFTAIWRAMRRGWDAKAHINALLTRNDEMITLTHPVNYLTEAESEVYFFS